MDSYNVETYARRGKTIVLTLRQDRDEPSGRQWSDTETNALLRLMEQNLPEFRNQRRRKNDIWLDISNDLKCNNYFWDPQACRKKWSNMLRTFKVILEGQAELISKKIRWNFYDQMSMLLSLPFAEVLPESGPIMSLISGTRGEDLLEVSSTKSETEWRLISNPSDNTMLIEPDADLICENPSSAPHDTHDHEPDQAQEDVELEQVSFITTEVIGAGYHNDREDKDMDVLSRTESGLEPGQGASPTEEIILSASAMPENQIITQVPGSSKPSSSSNNSHAQASRWFSIPTNRKRKRKISHMHDRNRREEPSVTEQFIAMTKEHNDKVISLMTKFHEDTLDAMRERNNILRDFSHTLKQDMSR